MAANAAITPSQIFRSLARNPRPWTLTRTLRSDNLSDLNGQLKGSASFTAKIKDERPDEMVYHEEGSMGGVGPGMAGMRWSRKYIWRLSGQSVKSGNVDGENEQNRDALSVWFVKPTSAVKDAAGQSQNAEAETEADYVFHELEFVEAQNDTDGTLQRAPAAPTPPKVQESETTILIARGHHLCINDTYQTVYAFRVKNGDVLAWASRHVVNGPKKGQDIVNLYEQSVS